MTLRFSTVAFATLAMSVPAAAADLITKAPPPEPVAVVSPFDYAFGGKIMSDYNFRGISQSDRGPSATAYAEGRYNFNETVQVYGGLQAWAVKLPSDPSAEVDIYGGARFTLGNLGLDVGGMYYWYPREKTLFNGGVPFVKDKNDFFEVYGKASYTINDMFSVGANIFYAPNWLNTGATGTYASATAKVTLPHNFALSGELGRYFLGTTDAFYGFARLPDYTYWNAGISYTYKVATLDFRYHDTTLSKTQCFGITGDPSGLVNGGRSRWCGAAFIATLSFDLTSKDLK
ncbi:MAG TPA: TorF family putative porin [Beijerinckiaceae bacterium]|jgi:uncharacterized protein (TIGR02001 family)